MNEPELNELQRDAITELLNIGVGRAAAALSEMVDQEVGLTVPHLDFVPRSELTSSLGDEFGTGSLSYVSVLTARFGVTLFDFPEARSMDIVSEVMQGTVA